MPFGGDTFTAQPMLNWLLNDTRKDQSSDQKEVMPANPPVPCLINCVNLQFKNLCVSMDLAGKMIERPIKPELTQQENVVQVKVNFKCTDAKSTELAFGGFHDWPDIAKIQRKRGYGDHRNPSICFGGDEGDRTPDLSVANAALSQLSYTPIESRTIETLIMTCLGLFLERVKKINCRGSASPGWFFPSTGPLPPAAVHLPYP